MRSLLTITFLAICTLATRAADPFEIEDGDRVLFLGDTLLEREGTYGCLETRMHEQFPDRHFTVRNLAFSADTPLGWSRASFDPAVKGFERLKEQLALVNPTVVFLGYGMAASLQELTDRSNDPTLNPDPARYGAEPMSPERFKKELGQLMDAIVELSSGTGVPPVEAGASPGSPPPATPQSTTLPGKKPNAVRFVLLSPIDHEDLRTIRPGLPDPALHNELLKQYTKALENLASERQARFLPCGGLKPSVGKDSRTSEVVTHFLTDNGIHLNEPGYRQLTWNFNSYLGWAQGAGQLARPDLRAAIVRKNELFFHRWRPANSTYLFGFRKHEQGKNAKEIPEFDPLIDQAEAEIDRLKKTPSTETSAPPTRPTPTAPAAPADPILTLPKPDFTVADGFQIELWAENPLLYKPTQMNWDARGRLWVASSALYPQIAPGGEATDTIIVLEDADRDGKADRSSVFAGNLLIPTAVQPTCLPQKDGSVHYGCYVGQSTELLFFEDTDGDGTADTRRIVLSGFGTEDTHHIIHTLKRGPDHRIYFNQSVYIHTHLETPWGVVRLNSGGVLSWDPRTEKVEVFSKGLWNTWGHQFDKSGQSFQTDGAGSTGLTWSFPGATFNPFEGSRRTMPSISPGSYPKFAGLELIYSPHFPDDWQGNAITCDFRAHRIVRFGITDLAEGEKPQAGYTTAEKPDLVRTSDVSFRPIDVKLGPDGALYVADWSNPVINHGEVDFRDPRRDHTHGRIWRITRKDAPLATWESLATKKDPELLDKLLSANLWEKEQARGILDERLVRGTENKKTEPLAKLAADPNPRVRLEAIRLLGRNPDPQAMDLILDAAVTTESDPFLEYAAWLSINELAPRWTQAIADGSWKIDGRDKQLQYGLTAIDPRLTGTTLTQLMAKGRIDLKKGPWIELIGRAGGPPELATIFESLIITFGADCCPGRNMTAEHTTTFSEPEALRAIAALLDAVRVRNVRPDGELSLADLATHAPNALRPGFIHLAGYWKTKDAPSFLPAIATAADAKTELRLAAIEALRALAAPESTRILASLCDPAQSFGIRRAALTALASLKFAAAADFIPAVLRDVPNENEALATWRGLLAVQGSSDALLRKIGQGTWAGELPRAALAAGVRATREGGRKTQTLLAALTPLTGITVATTGPADYKSLAERTKKDGDPAQGELIYRQATTGCSICHAIGGAGGVVGPALTSIGASAPLDYIIESMLAPNSKVKEGYNAVTLKLKDGTEVTGIQARETAQEVILRNVAGQETSVPKASITGKTDVGSIMPAGLVEQLGERERLNLYAFLGELGKPGPYDASKSNVARVWRLYSGAQEPQALQQDLTSYVPPIYTRVDGRLSQAVLAEALPQVGDVGRDFYATAQFQVATAGKVRLNLMGVNVAWLDGQPLAIASEPNPSPALSPGVHTLAVKLDRTALPAMLRAEADGVIFLGN